MPRALAFLLPFAVATATACSSDTPLSPPTDPSTAAVNKPLLKPDKVGYVEDHLVADRQSIAHHGLVDPNLVNPWGLAFGPTGILWVANNGSGTSTLYNEAGEKQSLTATIPSATSPSGGVPTGVIFNGTSDFVIPSSTAAKFIFAGEDGTISAWNGGSSAVTVADRSTFGAVYKDLAMATSGGANFLYLTNFHQNKIDVFNASYGYTTSFTDASIPAGYAPFGIHNIGGMLYVTFAKQLAPDDHDDAPGPGHGYLDIFNPNGALVKRFASTGTLNSPWAVVLAPSGFGPVSGTLLVGNFGDGRISSFNPTTGAFIGFVEHKDGRPIEIDGLWDLTFGPGAASATLYFSSGPHDESDGLMGTLTVKEKAK